MEAVSAAQGLFDRDRSTFGSDAEESEVGARRELATARFHRLLDYCADALGESIRATEELSQRMSCLRKEIESQSCRRPTTPAVDRLVDAPQREQVEP
jgi:hypothetical protein